MFVICDIAKKKTVLQFRFNQQGTDLKRENLAQCRWSKNHRLIIADSKEKAGIL